MAEVRAYDANPTAATAKCGPIAEWDVSAITDMSELFMEDDAWNSYGYGADDVGLDFNADISNWDTSSVTTMYQMFYVRSSPCPAPYLQPSPPLHAACPAVARRLPPSRPAPRPAACPPFDSRQNAKAFNQPLSFDTSSVTNMAGIFYVRSSPCPVPISAVEPSPARCVHRGHPPPPAVPARTSPRNACPPFDSRQNAKAFNQPLSFDTSSVTNMQSVFAVRSFP
eukprot:scaffold45742_cov55-Phaeocystis_antarctica.AAC.5